MKPKCFRCGRHKGEVYENKTTRVAYWIREKDVNNLFVCRDCDKELKEKDPAWKDIEKAWHLLGRWTKDDQKRYMKWNRKIAEAR